MSKPILVTGVAGFIGFHLARRLLADGHEVAGIDNLNDYYDPQLKQARLGALEPFDGFRFHRGDIADADFLSGVFSKHAPNRVLHMAAQGGVRYSLEHPQAYIDSNLVGFGNILEACRHNAVEHLVFASSSSVYGANTKMPFSESDNVDHPISLYAATKKSNELMAHSYAHLYGLPMTGLRFFTVYGPWGRPDMAYFKFVDAMYSGRAITVFNNGDMYRDFTYIDDVVEGVLRVMDMPPSGNERWSSEAPDPATSAAPYRIFNIGNHTPEKLADMIALLEELTGITAEKDFQPMQPGDVYKTYADVSALSAAVGFEPSTPLAEGLDRFVTWYRDFYQG
ncbi:MAG: NAD-dependent epimerase [Gammaproteobacteria bacterium]|nr:NAD-dependent epimerase [Gammaproteobacteria bacterium]